MVIINSFKYPESNIKYQQRNIRVIMDKKDLGQGTLFISENTFSWQQTCDSGFTVSYTDISLHAISKDINVYPKECLYVMLDGYISRPGNGTNSEQNNDGSDNDISEDEESQTNVTEILLVPEEDEETNSRVIKEMYENIKICQELNPDPEYMEEEEDDDDDHLYEDAEDETEEGLSERQQPERGGGDADVDELSRRIQHSGVNITYNYTNGHEDEFQDAD